MSDEQLRYEEEKYQYEESHREMKYPRTNNAYHKSRRDNSDRIDALLAECEKMEDELAAQGKLERERDEARERADTMFAKHVDILDQARRERDEARAESIRWQSIAEGRGRTDDEEQLTTVTAQRDRLAEVVNAATILIAAKGRHNTMLAYEGLRKTLQSLTPDAKP
jgi:uncharacterized coiled-coil DUF342 family protein